MSDVVDVKTAHATYRGLREAGVLRFYGVRYAEPPLGPLRFLPPVPLAETGTVDATRPGLSPAQVQGMLMRRFGAACGQPPRSAAARVAAPRGG